MSGDAEVQVDEQYVCPLFATLSRGDGVVFLKQPSSEPLGTVTIQTELPRFKQSLLFKHSNVASPSREQSEPTVDIASIPRSCIGAKHTQQLGLPNYLSFIYPQPPDRASRGLSDQLWGC